ncbi:bacteriophage holin [Candidatus Peribacteria bacterium]|jgi:hypothetical protein|nr:bacteriophage holin [Candidatus Peribacteria bacterium]MBT4021126.1 bacteriophage holin [Candidatus Peribacteria bacterium]MBT4240718.1 bacteriophage holin [Candidatus Peribacteria bacterium]MBT4474382.1 bacteriophage holin [Candidatus Peribacteria bacterium]
MKTFDPKNLGLALGSTMAIGLALLSIISMFDGSYGNTIISIISSVYLGYDNTIPGAVIGAIWGFIDGFIGGYVLAWLYNKFSEK